MQRCPIAPLILRPTPPALPRRAAPVLGAMPRLLGALLAGQVLLAGITPVRAQEKLGDTIWQTAFEGEEALAGWRGGAPGAAALVPKQGWEGTQALKVEVPAGSRENKLQLPLPVELPRMRGANVLVEAMVKAEGVVQPPLPYQGVKVMLHTTAPSGDRWMQQNGVHGTFEWKPVRFVTALRPDITALNLVVGLENTTGTVWMDDIRLTLISPPLQKPFVPPAAAPDKRHRLPRLRGMMVNPDIKAADLRDLAAWKVNLVRWQLRWNGFPATPADDGDLDKYQRWLAGQLDYLDTMLPLCQELGIGVLIDLHTPPGGHTPDKKWRLFLEKRCQDKFIEIWEQMARRYRKQKSVWGYDLVNEPQQDYTLMPFREGVLDWRGLASLTARRVRAIDKEKAIIVEAELAGAPSGFTHFQPLDVPGVVYSAHVYSPFEYTHQGIPGNYPPFGPQYPGPVQGKQWDKEALRQALQPLVEWQRAFSVPVYIGEFSAIRWAPGAATWIRDVIELFEEYDWDWTYHAFREYPGWSVEHGEDRASSAPSASPTARALLLRQWFGRNEPYTPIGSGAKATKK